MPIGSMMLKLDKEIKSVKVFQLCMFTYIYVSIPSLFMKEEEDPLFMESG